MNVSNMNKNDKVLKNYKYGNDLNILLMTGFQSLKQTVSLQ